jgi:hypothetical protein
MDAEPDLSPAHLARFVRAVAVLALPADGQETWLRSLDPANPPIDEIALEFDDGYRLVPQFIDRGWLPSKSAMPLGTLDALLSQMSGPAGPWSLEALRDDPQWQEVRESSQQVLTVIA